MLAILSRISSEQDCSNPDRYEILQRLRNMRRGMSEKGDNDGGRRKRSVRLVDGTKR